MSPSEGRSLLLVLALLGAQLVGFALLDRRPLNDHDPEFAGAVAPDALRWPESGFAERLGILRHRLLQHGQRHPQLPQTVLTLWTGSFGWSRAAIRLGNLPWLLLLLLGVWAGARQLMAPHLALLATWLAGTLPLLIHMSRKWFPHFFAAALAALAMAGLLLLARRLHARAAPPLRWWLGFGLLAGLRLHCHPIGVPDVALLFALLAAVLLRCRAPRSAWGGWGAAVALAALLGAPALAGGEESVGFVAYLSMQARYLGLGGAGIAALGSIANRLETALLPGAALLVVLPGLLGLGLPGAGGWSSFGGRLLALRIAAQVPLLVITVGNGGFLSDWLLLMPDCVLLCTLGLARLARRIPHGRWLLALAALQGAATLAAPFLVAPALPDLLAPDRVPPALRSWLGRSEHGGLYNTHHLLLRREQPGARLAAVLPPTERIDLLDLRFEGRCSDPVAEDWRWAPGNEGFSALPGSDPLEEAWGFAPEYALAPDPLGAVQLVRLWGPEQGCPPARRTALIDAARRIAEARLGCAPQAIEDAAQWFLASPRPTWQPEPGYLGSSLLCRR